MEILIEIIEEYEMNILQRERLQSEILEERDARPQVSLENNQFSVRSKVCPKLETSTTRGFNARCELQNECLRVSEGER